MTSVAHFITGHEETLCCAVWRPPYIIHYADYILFKSFEIVGYILTNQKILIGLDSCSRSSFFILWVPFDTIQSFESTALSNVRNYSMSISFLSPDHVRVIDEASKAETLKYGPCFSF